MIHTDTTPAEEVNDVVIELPELGRHGQGACDDGEAPSPPAPSPPAGPSLSIPQLILPMYLPSLLLGITIGMGAPVIPLFARTQLGASSSEIGIAIAAVGIGKMAANVPAGLFVAKFGAKTAMLLSAACVLASGLLAASAPAMGFLMISRVLYGVAFSFWQVARQVFVAAVIKNQLRGRAMSYLGGQGRVSKVIGPLIGGFVAFHVSARAVFVGFSVLALAAAVVVALAMPSVKVGVATGSSRNTTPSSAKAQQPTRRQGCGCINILRRHWATLLRVGTFTGLLMVVRTNFRLVPPLIGHDMGLAEDSLGIILAVMSFFDAVMFPFSGQLMDKCGRKCTGVLSPAIMAIGFVGLGLCSNQYTMAIACAVIGAGNGLSSGMVMTLGADLAPEDNRAEFIGVYRLFSDTGVWVGPSIIGLVSEHMSLRAAAFGVAMGAVAAVVWMVLVVPETLNRPPLGRYDEVESDSDESNDVQQQAATAVQSRQ